MQPNPSSTIDAVLPLTLRDLDRAGLLFESLARRFRGLGTLWIVCPDVEVRVLDRCLRELASGLNVRVEAEGNLVPELRLVPLLKGWYRQQLVKLAIHERVRTDLYLTLDADVICTKRVCPERLAPNRLAPCHVIERDLHPDWYDASESVLELSALRRGVLHNVTPALLHRDGVAALARYLEERARRGAFSNGVRGLKQRLAFARARASAGAAMAGWRLLLAGGAPWTEYALYYTFLEATGLFGRFHEYSSTCIYDVERSVWRADRAGFDGWDPSPSFSGEDAPWFVVVQSNTAIAPERVRAKLARYVDV